MNTKKITFITITPVLFSFFVMSFCDLVGIGVDNAMADFQLSNIMAQLIPSAVFVWFFFLSVSILSLIHIFRCISFYYNYYPQLIRVDISRNYNIVT